MLGVVRHVPRHRQPIVGRVRVQRLGDFPVGTVVQVDIANGEQGGQ